MSETWEVAPQAVIDIAEELIIECHEHLSNANIGFLFREKAIVSRGVKTLGKAIKVSDRDKVNSELDFIIWISSEDWFADRENAGSWRRALVDHELCHCRFDESKETYYIRPHDIEEFNEVIERHGIWNHASMKTAIVIQPKLIEIAQKEREGGSVVAVNPDEVENLDE